MRSVSCILYLSENDYITLRGLSKASKNLYNCGLYNCIQYYTKYNELLTYNKNYHLCKTSEYYKILQSSCAQQVLRMVERNMKAFLKITELYKQGKIDKPNLPNYLNDDEFFILAYPTGSFNIRNNILRVGMSSELSNINLFFDVPKQLRGITKSIKEIHILPRWKGKRFIIEFMYQEVSKTHDLNINNILSIDLGITNFASIVDTYGNTMIISGKYIKSYNRLYNKENAKLLSRREKLNIRDIPKRDILFYEKRKHVMNDFCDKSVNFIINHCINNKIGHIVIGDFSNIKHKCNMGKKNNQNFIFIPYYKFKRKLMAKCELHNINLTLVNEAYTSKCDALALEPIEKRDVYLGKRINRGLFQSSTGKLINADINGALNIMRKVSGDSVVKQIISSGHVFRPVTIIYDGSKLNYKNDVLISQ